MRRMPPYLHNLRTTATGRQFQLMSDGQGQPIPVLRRCWVQICPRCASVPVCTCPVPPVSNAPDYSLVEAEIAAARRREVATPPAPTAQVLRLRRFEDAAHEGVPPLPDVGAEVLKIQRARGQRA